LLTGTPHLADYAYCLELARISRFINPIMLTTDLEHSKFEHQE